MRCGECGSKNIKRQNVQGRSFRWKDFSSAHVIKPLELHVCQDCNNIITKAGENKLIDEAIESSITEQVRIAISRIKEDQNCEQKDIAKRLGITPEHLSEIKSGRAMPSFQLFNFLKTLALDKNAYEVSNPDFKIDYKAALTVKNLFS